MTGAVPAEQRWTGVPATRTGKAAHRWPDGRPPRSRRWTLAYGVTSLLLGLLPALAALPGLLVLGRFLRGAPTLAAALRAALAGVPLATVVGAADVRAARAGRASGCSASGCARATTRCTAGWPGRRGPPNG